MVDGTSEEVVTEENIRDVYGVTADIARVDGRPYVIFHADESMHLGGVDFTSPDEIVRDEESIPTSIVEPQPH